MQHSGFKTLAIILIVFIGTGASCAGKSYSDTEMAQLSTLVRTTLNIVKGKYFGKPIPATITEAEIIEIVRTENSQHFEQLKQLKGKIELKMVSDGKHLGAVAWDSSNNRKLLQDLQCTIKLDDPAWQREESGQEFTLDWKLCMAQ